ncbi:futalosine hydrolase [Streptomyces cocklensis]|uniref:Futalosine hydrolase n=1 Tax=Actinacidiphila cocklensis TaxID=887465 RepID=A0A9W4E6D3_9ACTN|nr:futalosine hydrolase [Actinacidiphila cocklensis]MDD1057516.1 futalosine hydrolase [Actinacidiphila cocklensis]WSX78963.1 futalosine hydrolase [Streptomyces sp. NBC_00899]CAG6393861.1 Futalosine hydrolase [Actinacidiphila cocklensis]
MRARRRHVLVLTAVDAERDAVAAGLAAAGRAGSGFEAVTVGVGPAAAAAGTMYALMEKLTVERWHPGLVISAGIGGGFAPAAPVGSLAVAETIVAADLGAQTAEGFAPVAELGFGRSEHRPPAGLSRSVADALAAAYGPVLTVSTVTGTAERAAELAGRHPGAVAEAMEGFGVAEAAAFFDFPVLEIRAVSNAVGPRDRAAWRIGEALAALTSAFGKLPGVLEVEAAHDGT